MKMISFLPVFGLVALLLAGCDKSGADAAPGGGVSPSASQPEKIIIGFLVKKPEEPWFQSEWKFADQAAARYKFEVVKIGVPDGEKVLSALDNLSTKGAQGLVICTPDIKLGPAIMASAKAKNLKVLAVDDQFVGADGKPMEVPYLGISARNIGEAVGTALAEEMNRRGWQPADTAACALTYDELLSVRDRTDGAADALIAAGFPRENIFRLGERNTDVEAGLNAANIVLTQHPDVKHWLVFSVNDEGVLGAVRAMEGRQLTGENVVGIGIGGATALAEFRKTKPTGFYGTMLISARQHGFTAAEMLYEWIKDGKEPPKTTLTSGTLVTRMNYESIMKEQGLLD